MAKFKGSVMSIGSDCSVGTMLSYLGIRESGALDWVDNLSGMLGIADVFSGALENAIINNSLEWVTRVIRTSKDEPEKLGTICAYHGLEFVHHDFNDYYDKEEVLDLIKKTKEFALQDGKFVYLPSIDETEDDLNCEWLVQRWFEDNSLDFDNQVLILPKERFSKFFGGNIIAREELAQELANRIKDKFGEQYLIKREDYRPYGLIY